MRFQPSHYSGGWIPDWVPVIGTQKKFEESTGFKKKFEESTGFDVDHPGEPSTQQTPPAQEEPDLPDNPPGMKTRTKVLLGLGACALVGGTIYFWPRR